MPSHPKSSHHSLSPEERLHQVAAIFARGVLRLKSQGVAAEVGAAEAPPDSSLECLEDSAEPRLTVVRGTTG